MENCPDTREEDEEEEECALKCIYLRFIIISEVLFRNQWFEKELIVFIGLTRLTHVGQEKE